MVWLFIMVLLPQYSIASFGLYFFCRGRTHDHVCGICFFFCGLMMVDVKTCACTVVVLSLQNPWMPNATAISNGSTWRSEWTCLFLTHSRSFFFAVFETCCRHCHEPCGLSQILSTASDPQRQVCGSSLQAYDCARGTLSADMLITHIRNPYCWPTILQPLQFVHRGGYQVSLYLITRVAVHPHVIVRVY